jgi:hypothetical protein
MKIPRIKQKKLISSPYKQMEHWITIAKGEVISSILRTTPKTVLMIGVDYNSQQSQEIYDSIRRRLEE